jgi:hypothetical protein
MKIARGNESNIAPAFEPRMEILLDLMQVCFVIIFFFPLFSLHFVLQART